MDVDHKTIYYDLFSVAGFHLVGVGVTSKGLCLVSLANSSLSHFLRKMKVRFPGWVPVRDQVAVGPVRDQLLGYFSARVHEFTLELDLFRCTPFQTKVLQAARDIPYGRTVSYAWLGQYALGNAKAARAVGGALGSNPVPVVIPCHRVLARNGSLGGFSSGLEYKRRLLRLEGAAWKE